MTSNLAQPAQFPNTDAGALLVGVFAVVVVPLTESGRWAWLNTAVAIVVALTLWAFVVEQKHALSTAMALSIAAAFGLIAWVGFAWPVQEFLIRTESAVARQLCGAAQEVIVCDDDLAGDLGTRYAQLPALYVVAFVFTHVYYTRVQVSSGETQPPSET